MGTSWQQKCFCCLLFLILVFFCVVESMDSHGDWRFFCYMLLSIFYYVVILFEPNSSSSCCSVTIQPCPGLSSLFFLSTVLIPLHGWRWINGWACRIGLPSPSSFWQHEDDVVGSYLACIPSSLSSHACERQRTVSASEWRWPESIVIILKALGSLARTHVRLAGWLAWHEKQIKGDSAIGNKLHFMYALGRCGSKNFLFVVWKFSLLPSFKCRRRSEP